MTRITNHQAFVGFLQLFWKMENWQISRQQLIDENLTKQGNLWKFEENNLKIQGKESKKKNNNEEIKILY